MLQLDQSPLGVNLIHAIAGIAVLALALWANRLKWTDIGYEDRAFARRWWTGPALAVFCVFIVFLAEYLMLWQQKSMPSLIFFIANISLTGEQVRQAGWLPFVWTALATIIVIFFEESLFRGLLRQLFNSKYGRAAGIWIPSTLYALWAVILTVRDITFTTGWNTIGVLTLAFHLLTTFLMAFSLGLQRESSGSIWMPLGCHFAITFLLQMVHIRIDTTIDHLLPVRRLFVIILLFVSSSLYDSRKRKKRKAGYPTN
ncbi:MAG: CPBP family intramembrane glutamic endopeptidase [Fastidiosipilaceae bacterium]